MNQNRYRLEKAARLESASYADLEEELSSIGDAICAIQSTDYMGSPEAQEQVNQQERRLQERYNEVQNKLKERGSR